MASIRLPGKQWAVHEVEGAVLFLKVTKIPTISHSVKVCGGKVEIQVQSKEVKGIDVTTKDTHALETLIKRVDRLRPCEGTDFPSTPYHPKCYGWVSDTARSQRCNLCRYQRKSEAKAVKRRVKTKPQKSQETKQKIQQLKRSKQRIYSKVTFVN